MLALDNTSLDGIEQIDLGSDDNTLVLSQIEVLRLSDSSNTLRVLGDASDQVTLSDDGWLPAGTVTDAGRARLMCSPTAMRRWKWRRALPSLCRLNRLSCRISKVMTMPAAL